ncbi:MAG: Beta-lactamase-like [uncultured Sulfurovum sp.]|uniref:Beta-lactamase-like n=1 Tax=uncultured Sulfurovum sp. TaxID=269237 RepID=A0A6S6T380_9BACT|nr:MAG: Beta-lactamase-like [uncultured Sulfurovum sp.]
MKKILSIVLILAFVISMPFIFNKSVTVENPNKLDIDGNFILNEWVPSRVGEGPDWDYNLKPVKISDRVWCYFGAMEMPTKENAGDMSNSCYIKGDTEWITWDTGPSYVFAEQAYAEMKKIADMPVKTVIISHEHDDHWLGNNYYKEVHGAKIIGAHSINENYFGPRHIEGKDYPGMQTRMIKALYQNATRKTVLALTDEAHEDTVEFTISGVNLEYVKVGYAHSEEDWYLYLPDDKVILAADVVMNGRVTSNRDGLVIGQINAINSIRARDWDYLVPGHGFITDKTAADESVKYFALLTERVLDKMEDGIIADFITKEVTLDEYREKDLYYVLSPQNVFRSYEELEMYDEDDLIDYVAIQEEKKAKKAAEAKAKAEAEEKMKAEAEAEAAAKVEVVEAPKVEAPKIETTESVKVEAVKTKEEAEVPTVPGVPEVPSVESI